MEKIEKDKVSIITPLYNAEKYIKKTIESVIAQSYKNWELLIIDDNSKDNSASIVEKMAEEDARIKFVKNKENIGVVNSRNKLIDLSTGRYVAFLDADDYWDSRKLEKQINFMKENEAEISCTNYTRITEDDIKINEIKVKQIILKEDMLKNNYMGCLTVMYDIDKIGKRYFKERKKNEDYVLWLEIVEDTKKIYGLQENLAYYRVLNNSRSSNKLTVVKDRWEIYRKVEKISLIKSIYYFVCYVIIALYKSK